MTRPSIDDLAAALQDYAQPSKVAVRSTLEERVMTGFEEIQDFIKQHSREPLTSPDRDVRERILGTRLKAIRRNPQLQEMLAAHDSTELLQPELQGEGDPTALSPDQLAQLLSPAAEATNITQLKHVRPFEARQAPDEVAIRKPCSDFHLYEGTFKQVAFEVANGVRKTQATDAKRMPAVGDMYIVDGQTAFVEDVGEVFINEHGNKDARLRVIYDNGTENNLLMRSLQRALSQDPTSRIILDRTVTPLFGATPTEEDITSGTIYVLRSNNEHPYIAQHRELVHKIGVTTGSISRRIANAKKDPTFLMAEVEVVATYELYNINRKRLEQLLHSVFAPARLQVNIEDRFGHPINPREWFLVPLFVIQEAIERLKDGSITDYYYDPPSAGLRKYE